MKQVCSLGFLVLVGCGAATPSPHAQPSPPVHEDEPSPAPTTSRPSQGVDDATLSREEEPAARTHLLLDGRFEITLPTATTLRASSAWDAPEELRAYYDSYEFNMNECAMTLAVRSHGLLRPRALSLRDGEARVFAPSADASPHLEILTTHSRPFDVLGAVEAAVGAVAFEPDGSATDFFLWPHLAPGEESVEPEGDEWDTEDWFAAQRADPRRARCYEVAETLLHEALPTLVARRPFSLAVTQLHFGYDEAQDQSIPFAGVVPSGWVITSAPAYDARFEDLHRRQPWAWVDPEPAQRARVWSFNGSADDDDDVPPQPGSRRAHLFGHDLRFDRDGGEDGQCAWIAEPGTGLTHTVCVRGTRAQRDELVAILGSFVRVNSADGATPHAPTPTCVMRIRDADGETNARAGASSRSDLVGTIPNDTAITPLEQRGRWLRIAAPHAGWVYAEHVDRQCR